MFELQRLCESDDRIGVRVCNSFNSPLLSISAVEVCRGDDNFLTDNPIEWLATRHSIQGYIGSACFGGDVEIGPSDGSLNAMHLKLTIVHANDLVSKDG